MTSVALYPPGDHTWLYLCVVALFEAQVVYLWQFRKIPGAMPRILNQACMGLMILSRVCYGMSTSFETKLFWAVAAQWLLILIALFWLAFMLEISGQKDKLPRSIRYFLLAFGVTMMLLITRNDLHGWYWTSVILQGEVLQLTVGPLNRINTLYCYLLVLIGIGFGVRWALIVQGLRRAYAIAFLLTPLLVVGGNILGRITALHPYEPQLIGVALTGIYSTWIFQRWSIFSILPLAYDTVSRTMIDGLLVVDEQGYIVEMNDTARTLFSDCQLTVGSRFNDLCGHWPELVQAGHARDQQTCEIAQQFPDGVRYFRTEMTPLQTADHHLLGRVFVLKEITRQKQDQARLLEQQKAISMLAERNRLGRELHDTLGQFPGYVKTQTKAISMLLEKARTADAAVCLEQLRAAAGAAHTDVRESIASLNIVVADGAFFHKLREWLGQFETMSGIATGYRGPDSVPQHWIGPQSELHLLRIIQEALTNVRKHARASRVEINITLADKLLNLTVADNGSGFADVAEQDRFGFGLRNIRERVAEMNGSFSIHSTPQSGTTLTVQAPLTTEGCVP